MLRLMKVLGGMLVFGRIATAHMPAFHAQPEVHPGVTHFQALFAPASVWRDRPDLIEMLTGCHISSSLNY
jgi:hypothetical protein